MKKLFLILILLITTTFAANAQAMGDVPSPITKVIFNNFNMASAISTVTIPFYQDENVSKLLVQADWKTITGDSAQVKIWVSATQNFLNSSQLNTLNTLKWKNGAGANITKWEAIDVSAYPVNYIKCTIDTLTGITTGTLTLTIKPLFNY